MAGVFRLLYVSKGNVKRHAVHREVVRIAQQAQAPNKANEVTGVLMFAGGYFCQLLEGPEAGVEQTYACIAADPRHDHCQVLMRQHVRTRRFPEFAMALVRVLERPHVLVQEAVEGTSEVPARIIAQTLIDEMAQLVRDSTARVAKSPWSLMDAERNAESGGRWQNPGAEQ